MSSPTVRVRKGHCPRSGLSSIGWWIHGQEKLYRLCDQRRVRAGRLRGAKKKRRPGDGPEYLWLRQVTVLREAGRQTAVLTNRQDLGEVAVVQPLFDRWTQENYFKYMEEEYALDALVEYGAEEVSATADRPNPAASAVGQEASAGASGIGAVTGGIRGGQ